MSPKYDSQWLIEFAERCPIQSNINEFGDIEDLPNEALIVMWKINEMEIIPLNRREIYWMKIWLREIYRIMPIIVSRERYTRRRSNHRS